MNALDLTHFCPVEDQDFLFDEYQSKPELFFEEILGVTTLEDYQRRVLKALWENDRVAVSACHDVGKTFLAARIAIAFLNVFPYSKVITTAPTFNQVERVLWSELRAAVNRAKIPLSGRLNNTDWTFTPDWFALGFAPRNELTGGEGQGTQSSFQGFHAEGGVLVIFEEATGIPHNVWTMAEGLMTSAHVKFLAIGNPTSTASEFYQCFRSPMWAKVKLSCFDSPNLIANGLTDKKKLMKEIEKIRSMTDAQARKYVDQYKIVKPYLLTPKWVVQNVMKWGIDHPLTVSKVFGEFPRSGEKVLMPLGVVEEAQNRIYYPIASDRKSIGLDVARFGADASVLTALHGMKHLARKEFFKERAPSIVGETIQLSREIGGADIIVVDETGLGGPVVDLLEDEVGKSLPKDCEIRGVQFGAACEDSSDKEKYANMKARMFGLLEEDLKRSDGLALMADSVYLEELPTIRKDYNKRGQLTIESKDDYKKRTGRKSPDNADSLALANFGHYDELKIGKFTKETTKDLPKPQAGGLRSKRNW